MDKIKKDKNNNIFNLFLISISLLPKGSFYFSFDFYKKSLFILTFTCGHCWVYVIFFACVYGGEVRMSALQLSDPEGNFFGYL